MLFSVCLYVVEHGQVHLRESIDGYVKHQSTLCDCDSPMLDRLAACKLNELFVHSGM